MEEGGRSWNICFHRWFSFRRLEDLNGNQVDGTLSSKISLEARRFRLIWSSRSSKWVIQDKIPEGDDVRHEKYQADGSHSSKSRRIPFTQWKQEDPETFEALDSVAYMEKSTFLELLFFSVLPTRHAMNMKLMSGKLKKLLYEHNF